MLLFALSCGPSEPPPPPEPARLVVLGFDGVDPDLVERWSDDLPWLASKTVLELQTTTPPQSPVAWTTFATGTLPGDHGIFDFVERQKGSVFPQVSTNSYRPARLGADGQLAAVASGSSLRHGETFWKTAADAGVPVTALWVPYSFPPEDLGPNGRMVSGLGTPDLRLTNGSSSLFTSKRADTRVSGAELVPLERLGDRYRGVLVGPTVPGHGTSGLGLDFQVDRGTRSVSFTLHAEDHVLGEGEVSDWLTVRFPLGTEIDAWAQVRIEVVEAFNELELYITPLSIHPNQPWLRFTSPGGYGADLRMRHGAFPTVGWVHDTSALQAGLIDEERFLRQADETFDARVAIAREELSRQDGGLFMAVFTATDRVSHMTWGGDLAHVKARYVEMDEALAAFSSDLRPQDTLVVLSDHGFHGYEKTVHTNAVLREAGLLVLDGGAIEGSLLSGSIDFSQTRAWSMGTGQVYLNDPTAADEVRSALEAFEVDGVHPISVRARDAVWSGGAVDEAPDLRLEFAPGWGSSRATRLGGVAAPTWAPAEGAWSGDHAEAPADETAGMLVADGLSGPVHIVDVAPTLLFLLGVPVPTHYTGTVVTNSGDR
ncbi:MAG: hypothetical protein GY913_01050 [Proteobacteria bacterium]|nr:hypothetical protein [Pseudomonadota bacterium]MCP4915485.1 hypothetical protein [Pseudomonadota bacterium]